MYPREKFLKFGIQNLSDMELIALVIGSGNKSADFLKISSKVIRRIKKIISMDNEVTIDELASIQGVGQVTAMKIFAGIELGRRLYYSDRFSNKCVVHNSRKAYEYLNYLQDKKKEYVVALFLNSRFELIKKKVICVGSVNNVYVLPRDIIIPALEVNAANVILAHNHPSGDCTQSNDDVFVTKRIKDALELVGMKLLDHIIVGKDSWSVVKVVQ